MTHWRRRYGILAAALTSALLAGTVTPAIAATPAAGEATTAPGTASPSKPSSAPEATPAFHAAARRAFENSRVAAVGFGADGRLVVQSVDTKLNPKTTRELDSLRELAEDRDDSGQAPTSAISIQEVPSAYGAKRTTVRLGAAKKSSLVSASPASTSKTVVAGAGYLTPYKENGTEYAELCTVGFPAKSSTGKRVLISAGHCGDGLKGFNTYLEAPKYSDANGSASPRMLDGRVLGTFSHVQYGPATGYSGLKPSKAQDFSVIPLSSR